MASQLRGGAEQTVFLNACLLCCGIARLNKYDKTEEFKVEFEEGGEYRKSTMTGIKEVATAQGALSDGDVSEGEKSEAESVKSEQGREDSLPMPGLEGQHDWTGLIEKYLAVLRSKKTIYRNTMSNLGGSETDYA